MIKQDASKEKYSIKNTYDEKGELFENIIEKAIKNIFITKYPFQKKSDDVKLM